MSTGQTDEMRKAVAARDWPAVLRLWDAYAAGIFEEIGRGACTRQRLAEAREFLEWTTRFALCARAQMQQTLNTIHAAQQYGAAPASRPVSLRISL
jgi:hypothetical protein